ncbi:MAG: hydrogenase expression/formation protein HypE, partial [Calditrichaeota bacterium]
GITIRESDIPIAPPVKAACEILGLDPLYVANDGKLLALVDSADADRILMEMRKEPLGRDACIIGEVTPAPKGRVLLQTCIGGRRIVDMLSGDQLPRIC